MKHICFQVPEAYQGASLKSFLRHGRGVSARLLSQGKRLDQGILKNGCPANVTETVSAGDMISLRVEPGHNAVEPEKLPVAVVWEDEFLLVLNKPANMPVHPCPGHDRGTLCNFVAHLQKTRGEDWSFRPLNRLDKDTSGLIIGAKDPYTACALQQIKKLYLGVCQGILTGDGTIDAPIRLKPGHSIQREIGQGGKPSVTHWRALAHGTGHTLLALWLETGRTHQIRVHLSGIGHPLAGDDFYGGSLTYLKRQALHCAEISWRHPLEETSCSARGPLPEDFEDFLQSLNIHNLQFTGDTFNSPF